MTKKKPKKILLSAGGTGGHLFPAIAIAEPLKKAGINVHLVTDLRCQKYLTDDLNIEVHITDLYLKFGGVINRIIAAFKTTKAIIKATFLVKKLNPDLVIGFGGYPSFPAVFAAKILKIPIIIYEPNCYLGSSNKFFANDAKIIALAFEKTQNLDNNYQQKVVIVGDIIRDNIKKLATKNKTKKDFDTKIFNIFIFGGSQGAKIFAQLIPEAIKLLHKKITNLKLNTKITVTQQAAIDDQTKIAKIYDQLNISYQLLDFFHNIAEIYTKSHLAISRAGSGTVGELTMVNLPAIFIPLPSAAADHQYYNAKALSDTNSSWCYRQEDLTPEILANKIADLIARNDSNST